MSTECYIVIFNKIYKPLDIPGTPPWPDFQPCSNATGIQTCCAVGDQCLSDGFCYFTHATSNPVSHYYTAGCTDPTFEDLECRRFCAKSGTQDVVYNATTGLWACCNGEDGLDCRNPGNVTFAANAPEQLSAATESVGTTSEATTSRVVSSSGAASAGTDSPSSSSSSAAPSSGSNTATIAVATAVPLVAVVAIIGGLGFLWRRRRAKRREAEVHPASYSGQPAHLMSYSDRPPHPVEKQQAEQYPTPTLGELPSERERAELPGAQHT